MWVGVRLVRTSSFSCLHKVWTASRVTQFVAALGGLANASLHHFVAPPDPFTAVELTGGQCHCVPWYIVHCVVLTAPRNTGYTTYRGRSGRLLKMQALLVTAHGQSQLSDSDVLLKFKISMRFKLKKYRSWVLLLFLRISRLLLSIFVNISVVVIKPNNYFILFTLCTE